MCSDVLAIPESTYTPLAFVDLSEDEGEQFDSQGEQQALVLTVPAIPDEKRGGPPPEEFLHALKTVNLSRDPQFYSLMRAFARHLDLDPK